MEMTLEDRLIRIENYVFGTDLGVPDVPTVSRDLYTKIKTIYHKQKQEKLDDFTSELAKIVPFRFLSKIPQKYHDNILSAIQNPNTSFALYYAYRFLEEFKEADEEFIAWFSKKLGI